MSPPRDETVDRMASSHHGWPCPTRSDSPITLCFRWRNRGRGLGDMRVAGLVLGVLASVMIVAPGCRRQSEAVGTQAEATIPAPTYFKAKHGFDGGLFEMIELSQREGFDTVRTIDDLARFASSVGGAIGFTAHPNFEAGTRSAQAVLWYTRLSPVDASWPLYLFDEREARKLPSAAARSEAMAAAEAKISGKMEQARRLIAAGGQRGVKLVGNPEERAKCSRWPSCARVGYLNTRAVLM